MKIVLLGPVGATADDASPVDIGGVRLRMLLARLALEGGRPVSVDALVDGVWGADAPAEAGNALQALVSRLRKALRGVATLESVAGGYRLSVRDEDVDAHRFEESAARGRRELAAGHLDEAASRLGAALALWRGPALVDVLDAPFARAAATRLDDVRAAAAEDRFEAELRLGRYAEILADLEAAGAERPLSERLAGLRMKALSAAGRQSDALAVYEEMRGRLGEELGVDPSAELRDIHLALLRGELSTPAARPEAVPSRLPARLTSFVGRDRELDRVARLLASSRLVTVVGFGGAGKTRLSLEAATRHRAYGRGRVWFAPLAGVGPGDEPADAVLGALSSKDGRLYDGAQGRRVTPLDRLADLLDGGEALLVLDNCEHLVAAVAELADELLARLPQLRILATSREALAITGEALCPLGPLEVPAASRELADAADSAAVRLFVDRAVGVRPDFALDATTAGATVEICRRLDGMPLALELAAAKLRSMSVDQIARRLDDRFRLLTSGSRTALPRQRTLLALVAWSWDLLDEPERILARRLSVFPGGATVAALEGVCADDTLPADDVVYVLGALVEKSLVVSSGEGEPRYRMLETVRAFAADRLTRAGDDVSLPFADHFLALAEEIEPLLRTGEQLRAIAVFDAEHDNMVAALRSVLDARDAARASRFVRAMFWYWGIRGMTTQFETFLGEVLELGDALPAEARVAFGLVLSAAGVPDAGAPPVRGDVDDAEVLGFHPALPLLRMSQPAGDAGRRERGLRQSLSSPDPWVRASAYWAHDFVLSEQGDLESGAEARAEALRGFEEVGDRWGLVMSLLPLGRDHSLRGEYGPALAAFERAVAISSELGTEEHLTWTKFRLSQERSRAGDHEGALRDLHAAQRQARERGHRRVEAGLLPQLAYAHRIAGEFAEADEALDRMEPLVHRLPYPEATSRDIVAADRMANLIARGAAEEARALLPRAVRGYGARGDSSGLTWVAEQLALLLALEGDPEGAAAAQGVTRAIRGAFDLGDPQMRTLTADLITKLGEPAYRAAYERGADLPRQEALATLKGTKGS
ncbi:winged helix-turn-helix domain-containing protein [Streptomyces sp. Je 1-79]|uniref:BTAD domain-containing putative transcriptional regulator n=1 Tax=Streptomyces sp. Je 1-79 TaxID=2943847 RepID=UPI0021A83D87|nr:BTAD domain-containing putative transcriptional regulator [Streptomyces sp. Je 1-79]MCT4353801.1 winged helix-turn-helix domain-containing protein [Streptomyces sp. Je 1-79]